MKRISVAKDFSSTPGPRWRHEGKHSGEEFREEVLAPALMEAAAAGETILVDLDGSEGYASSFLEEAFGGLVRQYPDMDVLKHIEIKSDEDPYRKAEVEEYVRDEYARSKSLRA
jgi:hypothetical protein